MNADGYIRTYTQICNSGYLWGRGRIGGLLNYNNDIMMNIYELYNISNGL